MTFTQKFDSFVCISDSITCTVDGYTVTARIAHDETPDLGGILSQQALARCT